MPILNLRTSVYCDWFLLQFAKRQKLKVELNIKSAVINGFSAYNSFSSSVYKQCRRYAYWFGNNDALASLQIRTDSSKRGGEIKVGNLFTFRATDMWVIESQNSRNNADGMEFADFCFDLLFIISCLELLQRVLICLFCVVV